MKFYIKTIRINTQFIITYLYGISFIGDGLLIFQAYNMKQKKSGECYSPDLYF